MQYYIVPKMTDEYGALTADVPDTVDWIGSDCANDYLIATATPIPGLTPLDEAALRDAAAARGLIFDDVILWRVG